MLLEFHQEIKDVGGRPYKIHINVEHGNSKIIKTTYCVERTVTSHTGRVRHSIYIKKNEYEDEYEDFVIMFPDILKKYQEIIGTATDKELASLRNPVLCSYSTGESFEGDPKYSVVMTNHKKIFELQSFLDFKNSVESEVEASLIGADSGVECE